MILLEIKQYIKQHHQVRFSDIKHRFALSESAAQALLAPLIRQGFVLRIEEHRCTTGACSTHCEKEGDNSLYQWLERPLKPLSVPIQIT
ncbi:MAG: transcriptional regulator [Gammaproteobacteria bacterium]|nr:transcriptional regulator [Gammaproteobacteria bacterium]